MATKPATAQANWSGMKLNSLVSYAYFNTEKQFYRIKEASGGNILMDSGAFTAFTKGKEIPLDEYITFMKSVGKDCDNYFVLDVIGNPEKTYNNYRTMLDADLSPVPIFTVGDDYEMIDKYYETSDVLGFGGLVGKSQANLLPYLKRIKKYVKGRKIHLLGVSNPVILEFMRPYSSDSSSYAGAWRYGMINMYMGNGKFKAFNKQKFIKGLSSQVMNRGRFYGIDVRSLLKDSEWAGNNIKIHHKPRFQISARSWLHFAYDLDVKFNTKFYFATTDWQTTYPLVLAYNYFKENHEDLS